MSGEIAWTTILSNDFKGHSMKTQTFKARFERFNTIDSPFHLQNTSFLKNKHILLIDDVITTGATIEACAKELQKIENVKISILSMAYTE